MMLADGAVTKINYRFKYSLMYVGNGYLVKETCKKKFNFMLTE